MFRDMIIPVDVTQRPPYPILAMEWAWELYTGSGTSFRVSLETGGGGVLITDAGLRVDDFADSGPLRFSVASADWEVPYEASFGATGVRYRPLGTVDALVNDRRGVAVPLSVWLNNHKPTLFLSGDRMITDGDRLLEPRTEIAPYPRDALRPLD